MKIAIVLTLALSIISRKLTVGNLMFSAIPTDVTPGITPKMILNCSFSPSGGTPMSHPTTIHISKVVGSAIETLATVDLLNVVRSEHVRHGQPVTTTGRINLNGSSTLLMEWDNPIDEDTGLFQCSILGNDNVDLPHEEVKSVTITRRSPSTTDLINRVIKLSNDLKNCSGQLSQMEATCVDNLNPQALSEYYAPMAYNDHRYFLSRHRFETDVKSSRKCEVLGGYLAEIDSREEQNEIVKLVQAESAEGVLVAGFNAVRSETWIFQRTGQNVVYFDWYPGEPNSVGDASECIGILMRAGGRMNDISCSSPDITSNDVYNYLCEVPRYCLV